MSDHPTRPMAQHSRTWRGFGAVALVVVLLLCIGSVGLFAARFLLGVALGTYEGRVYPNVYVLDVDLGGLEPSEAAARLGMVLEQYDQGALLLRDGERTWPVPWSDLGMIPNVEGTVQAALEAGRGEEGLWSALAVWVSRLEVAPVFVIDPEVARATLESLAPQISVDPVNATMRPEEDGLVAVPGQPGKALDVDATLVNLLTTVSGLGTSSQVAITFQPVMPRITDAGPAQAEAERLVNQALGVTSYDILTGETFSWVLDRDVLISWLRVDQTEDGNDLVVRADEEAIQETLSSLASTIGEGRGFRLEEAARQVGTAFESGGGIAELYLTHPQRSYSVQYGDTIIKIGNRLGVPPGIIAEVNPNIDLDRLYVGQELVIPSQDVLTPHIAVPGKRIEISIPQQRMRVYENGVLLYDWPVSTGIESSPTYPGTYQVLNKEDNAYGSQWDLWMPNFIAIYRAGGDVYNGIHALPILSNGQRLWAGALGTPASYGCIILGISEAETLYTWADMGVLVVIE